MAEDKLSGKAGLDTTEFKTGIAGMNRELRVLESGFRASAASLGDWANDASGLELRIKSLNSQMDIQRQKVAATRAEYERIKAEKGETSRAAQDLEIKLNKETETLGKMENELQTTEASLNEMQGASDETGAALDDLGESTATAESKFVSFGDVLESTKGIAAGVMTTVAGLVATVGLLVGAITGLVFSTAGSAAEMVDLSTKTGISTTQLQEMAYIGNQVGTSLDTMTGAQARLIRSMASAADQQEKFDEQLANGVMEDEIKTPIEMAAAFNGLGVAFTDSGGQLRDQQEVFAEVIDALGKIENPAERDALAMEIFGKSAQELNPLIKAGSDELARLAEEAHNVGAVMDEDAVAGLEAFDDTMASIQAGMKGTLGTLAAEFLPIFKEVGTALQDLFKSEGFKKGLQEFSQLLSGVVQTTVLVLKDLLSGDIQGGLGRIFGVENAAGIVAFFTTVGAFINDTLIPFVTVHAEEIKAALIGIGAALAAAGIIGIIAGIVAALNPATLIITAIVAAVGLLSAAWTGNWLGIRDVITQVWDGYIKPAFEALWAFLSTTIPAALQTLSGFWTGTLLPAIQVVWSFIQDNLFPLFAAVADFMSAVLGVAVTALAGLWQNVLMPPLQAVYGFFQDNILPIFKVIGDYLKKTLQPVFESFSGFLSGKMVSALKAITSAIGKVVDYLQDMASALNNLDLPDWLTPGSPTPWEIGLVGINKAMRDLNLQLPVLAKQLDQSLPSAAAVPGLGGFGQSSVQNDSFQFFAPVVIQGETTPGSLGSNLKGRLY